MQASENKFKPYVFAETFIVQLNIFFCITFVDLFTFGLQDLSSGLIPSWLCAASEVCLFLPRCIICVYILYFCHIQIMS